MHQQRATAAELCSSAATGAVHDESVMLLGAETDARPCIPCRRDRAVPHLHPDDPEGFEPYYRTTHLPLARRPPGLLAARFSLNVAAAPYFAVFEADFTDRESMAAAMSSPEPGVTEDRDDDALGDPPAVVRPARVDVVKVGDHVQPDLGGLAPTPRCVGGEGVPAGPAGDRAIRPFGQQQRAEPVPSHALTVARTKGRQDRVEVMEFPPYADVVDVGGEDLGQHIPVVQIDRPGEPRVELLEAGSHRGRHAPLPNRSPTGSEGGRRRIRDGAGRLDGRPCGASPSR